ncbi:DUF1003 domain-containing protein [Sphingomonas changnyeongensis]|uniref:DUF1003 domain-containing protein n=1 Tax=Sphingomonas changnyeongensis TaxID=2698679 RepID=A0A7Z2NXB4_9SPHN|nr:DUF1003 domain-containing protein [Sphingomonas changnyeongensis]QHL91553.1 DUF1003 domain-containing protein [Sphingomonas changnyeongensis]
MRSADQMAADLLGKELAALDAEEARVLAAMRARTPISRDAGDVAEAEAVFGDRLADRVAAVGGSWGFIITFAVVLLAWMVINTDVLGRMGIRFDPYPYIFLNLILSMLAAIQAPIIMMSQNRQAAKDRLAARLDYEVNLRAELEILRLHEKVDTVLALRLDELARRQEELARIIGARRDGG